MLYLDRKVGQRIKVGKNMMIKISEIKADGSVTVGIAAPVNIEIVREELLDGNARKRYQEKIAAKHRLSDQLLGAGTYLADGTGRPAGV